MKGRCPTLTCMLPAYSSPAKHVIPQELLSNYKKSSSYTEASLLHSKTSIIFADSPVQNFEWQLYEGITQHHIQS